ncbi:hypothetical protein [Microviridae sp.]|nr:hypothetical protein [Microviridae sp.]
MYKSIIKSALLGLFLTSVFQRCSSININIKIHIMAKKETKDTRDKTKEIVWPNIQNKYNFQGTGEIVDPISQTIQGESYTIQELLSKHSAGISPDIGKEPIWDDSANHNSLDYMKVGSMDLSEQMDYLEDAKMLVKNAEAAIKESKTQLKESEKTFKVVSDKSSEKTEEKTKE